MTPFLQLGTCVLASWTGTVQPEELGWRETAALELQPQEGCTQVELHLSDGQRLDALTGSVWVADGPRYRLGEDRVTRHPAHIDGTQKLTIHLPELTRGDRVVLELTRHWTRPGDFTWRPGLVGAVFAEMKLPKRRQDPQLHRLKIDKRFVWANKPTPAASLTLEHAWLERDVPPPSFTDPRGLTAIAAIAELEGITWLTRGFDGAHAVVGTRAMARRAVDDRGYARTLVALTTDGPDRVVLGRWSVDAEVAPGPDAPEVAVQITDSDAHLLLHPEHPLRRGFVHHEGGVTPVPPRARPIAESVPEAAWTTHLTVASPPGDPRRRLHPGGGALLDVQHVVQWSDTSSARTVFVPLPPGAEASASVAQPGTTRTAHHGIWMVVPPGTAQATIGWTTPLHDAWGIVPGPADAELHLHAGVFEADFAPGLAHQAVDGSGEVAHDHGSWHVTRFADAEILSTRMRMARELRARRGAASYPEPGISQKLRGMRRGWQVVEVLVPALLERAAPFDLPVSASWPRPLHRARRTRALTDIEFVTTIARYAQQSRLIADVILVRPHGAPQQTEITPWGFDHALLRLEFDGEARWIDPACTSCDTWELRPELVGAATLPSVDAPGVPFDDDLPRGIQATPGGGWLAQGAELPSGVGYWSIHEDGERVRWDVAGADALELRRWLSEVPADARPEALAAALGGPHETLEGLADAGQPATLVAPSAGSPFDPIAPETWLQTSSERAVPPHLGLRQWTRPASAPAKATCDGEGWSWWTGPSEEQDAHVEQLLITRWTLPTSFAADLHACREQAFAAPPPEADATEGMEPISESAPAQAPETPGEDVRE
jgi:hypothetical protein